MKNQSNKYAQLVEAQSPEPPEFAEPSAECKRSEKSCKPESGDCFGEQTSWSGENSQDCDNGGNNKIGGDNGSEESSNLPIDRREDRDKLVSNKQQAARNSHKVGDTTLKTIAATTMEIALPKITTTTTAPTALIIMQSSDGEASKQSARKQSQCSSQMSTSFISSASAASCASSSRLAQSKAQDCQQGNHANGHGQLAETTGGSSPQSSGRGETIKSARTISQSMLELDDAVNQTGCSQKGAQGSERQAQRSSFQVFWQDLNFGYKQSWPVRALRLGARAEPQVVLRNLSGGFKSNKLIAIIGPSGCGKTTLLQFLAGNNGHQQDRLKIVGIDEPKVAFIGQDDCLLPGLSARETLIYASQLQNSAANTGSNLDHSAHIERILEALGLNECADRNVTKLSGGQAKRVTIAQELLYPTNLLILDEVTSGLDASTSYSIVKLLKRLVSDERYPMSIVMSIHQPSARMFSVFDQVYLMSEGNCLYEGSCETESVNSYLHQFGLECPKFHNIADYLIEIASDDSLEIADKSIKAQMIKFQQKRSLQMVSIDFESQQQQQDKSQLPSLEHDEITMPLISNSLYQAIARARGKRLRPFLSQFSTHFARSLVRIKRSHILTYLQLLTYIILGLQLSTFYGPDIGLLSGCPRLPTSLMSFIFSNEQEDNSASEMRRIQENMNFMLVAVMTATFAALEITVITFPLEAKTVKREWRNGWYRVSSYFMGRTLADLPFQLAFVIIFCLIIYYVTGQIGLASWRFASFVLIMVMIALIAQSVGFIFGAVFMDNLPAAVFTAPICIFPALLFSGFFSRVSQIPPLYTPMTYLSHFKYGFDSLLVTLYGFDRCNCDQEILKAYHDGMSNQTNSIKVMFSSLFGSAECEHNSVAGENSIEDDPALSTTKAFVRSTTALPRPLQPLEDALLDSLFEQMKNTTAIANETATTATSLDTTASVDAMDMITQRFATKITSMLNKQANFGHDVPSECQNFNSYLMAEFDLHNDDLIYGISMLLVGVILSRLICQIILTFTIAKRPT